MSQPFSFDPKVIAKSLESWQKLWFGQATSSVEEKDVSEMMNAWQKYMQDQIQFWQGALGVAGMSSGKDDAAAEDSPDWSNNPFFRQLQDMYQESCQFIEKQMQANSAHLTAEQQDNLGYMTRQYLAALNPDNFLLTNPDALQEAFESGGKSVVQGMKNYWTDLEKGHITMSDDKNFAIGENVAATPGKVIFRNELIELIQYTPTAKNVYKKPLLIVPPCVNKYYLMDLSPSKSMVEYLVSEGYNVFLISWKSATEEMKHFTWDTYVERGVIAAGNVVREITDQKSINVLGFCVGGVILATALGVLQARKENFFDNAIFMASMADHSEPGDIKYFVTEELVRAREARMDQGGIISGLELQATFSALRPNDLIWNYVRDNYLKGKTPKPFDLLYWNNDSVDLPLPMHTFFLRQFYLKNGLTIPGSIHVCGIPMDMSKIDIPLYFFAAEKDHIVPWLSVYKGVELFSGSSDKRFVLGESGHIAGAINPVSKNRRSYWHNPDLSLNADDWLQSAENFPGSWWQDLSQWLSTRSDNQVKAPKTLGSDTHKPLCDAPGEFVRAKALPVIKAHFM